MTACRIPRQENESNCLSCARLFNRALSNTLEALYIVFPAVRDGYDLKYGGTYFEDLLNSTISFL